MLATPLGIAIGLYLAMMAPPRVRAVVGPLVEMLAAVPSIIYGFWGLIVLGPFIQHLEPGLHSALGFIPLFGPPQTTGISVFTAGLVLTMMILPIIAALSRDLFLTVPDRAEGRRRRARRHALGDDPRDRAAVDALRRERRAGARRWGARWARRSPSRW